jgi:hypothetical protein
MVGRHRAAEGLAACAERGAIQFEATIVRLRRKYMQSLFNIKIP